MKQRQRPTVKQQTEKTQFRQLVDWYDQELSQAFANWQRWKRYLNWFESRPRWLRWLLGGRLTRKILVFFEQSAEGEYWSMELQYH